jgi:hypothetical protein
LKRRNGIELVMECGQCQAVPGLEGQRCFGGVLAAVQREGVPVAITLHSHVERRYGLEASGSMAKIAGVLNKIDSLQAQLARDSGKAEACAACVRPLAGKLGMTAARLRGMDLNTAVSAAWDLERDGFGSNRSGCQDCSGMTRIQLNDIARALRELEKVVTRGAIKITEEER